MTEATQDPRIYLAHPDPDVRAQQGRRMGSHKSDRKTHAVRINGKLGGRPVQLGLLGLKHDPFGPRIKVSYSRSWGGIVFTHPSGKRETFTECRCESVEAALVLCDTWWFRNPTLEFFPLHNLKLATRRKRVVS